MPGSSRRAYWAAAAVTLVATTCLLFGLAHLAAQQAAVGDRVLNFVDPVFALMRRTGADEMIWLVEHGSGIALGVSLLALMIVMIAAVQRRRDAAILVLPAVAIVSATWGQVYLWLDNIELGAGLYVLAMAAAITFGALAPDLTSSPRPRRRITSEVLVVLALTLLMLVTRLYALPELPNFFNGEVAFTMLGSRNAAGLKPTIEHLLSIPVGIAHLLPQNVLFHVLGTSLLTLRLVAVLFSVLTVAPFYALMRRLGGRGAALGATLLLITAPEQIWFGRLENTYFALLPLLATISAHLALSMLQHFGIGVVLANALWAALTRYFYFAAAPLIAYPWILLGHGLLFGRGVWRRLWYVVPVLSIGIAVWASALSFAVAYSHDWDWRWINPLPYDVGALVQGAGAEGQGAPIRHRDRSLLKQFTEVVRPLAYSGVGTAWYQRSDFSSHPTTANAGLVVLAAISLGYLLGQPRRRTAAILLVWLGLGLLPNILSDEPTERRMALVYPALYAIIGICLDETRLILRERGSKIAAAIASVAGVIAILAIAWTSMVSYFSMPTSPEFFDVLLRAYRPMIQTSDAIYHNLDATSVAILALADGDRLADLSPPPCYESVERSNWLRTALRLPCSYDDMPYRWVATPSQRASWRGHPTHPQNATFLIKQDSSSPEYLALLRRLFPLAREVQTSIYPAQFSAFSVSAADVAALRTPTLRVAKGALVDPTFTSRLLSGTELRREETVLEGKGVAARVSGGLLLETDTWYQIGLEPACNKARLLVDGTILDDTSMRPFLAGIHTFEINLVDPSACALPINLRVKTTTRTNDQVVVDTDLVSPQVTALHEISTAPLRVDGGYRHITEISGAKTIANGLGVDAEGNVWVLSHDNEGAFLQRFDPTGRLEKSWRPGLPPDRFLVGMALARDAGALIITDKAIYPLDAQGQISAPWAGPLLRPPNLVLLPGGAVLACSPGRASLVRYGRGGEVEWELQNFDGGPGHFVEPVAVASNARGDVVVIQTDGLALIFRHLGQGPPQFVRAFRTDQRGAIAVPTELGLDEQGRIYLGDRLAERMLIYTLGGERVMAADRANDINTLGLQGIVHVAAAPNALYVLDATSRFLRLQP